MLVPAGLGVLVSDALVCPVHVLGLWHRTPRCCGPLRVNKEWGVVGSALGHDVYLCGGDLYYGDGGFYQVQGIRLPCRVPVDVGVSGYQWPWLIAVLVCQDGVCLGW